MRSGILEWVENSIPIGDYLVGNGNPGAHAMYSKPTHYAPNACRKLIRVCTFTNFKFYFLIF